MSAPALRVHETIHGVGPFPADPTRSSPFAVALAQALWYVSDGRPFDEMMAASGLGFGFEALPGRPPSEWGEGVVDRRLELLARAMGVQLRYVELATRTLADAEPARAWALLADEVAAALAEHRPPLARGGWPGRWRGCWGAITGMAANGLPAGHVYRPDTGALEAPVAMDAPPWQLVVLGLDRARPPARDLSLAVVAHAAADLAGEERSVVRLGETWHTGPTALEHWAERVEGPLAAGNEPATAAVEHGRVARALRDRRAWAARYLADTAGLRIGQLRSCRQLARDLVQATAALAPWSDAPWLAARFESEVGRRELGHAVREAARLERELGRELGALGDSAAR